MARGWLTIRLCGRAAVNESVPAASENRACSKSLRSVARYVKPGLAAIHQATEALSSPRRQG